MSKQELGHFTEGKILPLLVRFSLPVLMALLLQAMYGAVDLLVVGRFATAADVSAVATGSNMMMTITGPLSSFAMGLTVLLGLQIGQGELRKVG
ncbi:MAG: MATE family efflux transporter, partial [Blautia sp.]|nr:MATE family efflux transporter [Blautia sp.]